MKFLILSYILHARSNYLYKTYWDHFIYTIITITRIRIKTIIIIIINCTYLLFDLCSRNKMNWLCIFIYSFLIRGIIYIVVHICFNKKTIVTFAPFKATTKVYLEIWNIKNVKEFGTPVWCRSLTLRRSN